MYYSEGYGTVMLYEDLWGNRYLRRVENVFLPDWDGVDKTIRPVVDSSPGSIHTKVWEFDSYWHNKRELDSLLVDMLY